MRDVVTLQFIDAINLKARNVEPLSIGGILRFENSVEAELQVRAADASLLPQRLCSRGRGCAAPHQEQVRRPVQEVQHRSIAVVQGACHCQVSPNSRCAAWQQAGAAGQTRCGGTAATELPVAPPRRRTRRTPPTACGGAGRGELDTTFLDETLRISRGDKGNLFVLTRDS